MNSSTINYKKTDIKQCEWPFNPLKSPYTCLLLNVLENKVMMQIMIYLKGTRKLKADCFQNKEVKAVGICLYKSLAVNAIGQQL